METMFPIDDTVAAVLVAIALFEAEQVAGDTGTQVDAGTPWQASIKLVYQQLAPQRVLLAPTWGTVERLRRH